MMKIGTNNSLLFLIRLIKNAMKGFITASSDETETAISPLNADTLGGQLPSYYANQNDLTNIQNTVNNIVNELDLYQLMDGTVFKYDKLNNSLDIAIDSLLIDGIKIRGSGTQNAWKFEKYEKISSPTPSSFVGKTPNLIKTYSDGSNNTSMAIADNYSAKCTTYLYFEEATTLSISFTTDDEGSVTLNGNLLGTLTSCQAKSISCPFVKGRNELIVCYAEGSGGDGWTTSPRLYNHTSVKAMWSE